MMYCRAGSKIQGNVYRREHPDQICKELQGILLVRHNVHIVLSQVASRVPFAPRGILN